MTEDENGDLFSIGGVAEETGLSVDTIRVWERRYGRPKPVRLESGHRRYTEHQVRWLRRVAEALARGHRPSAVVVLSDEELDALLEPEREGPMPLVLATLLDAVREYRGPEILKVLTEEADRRGPRDFTVSIVAPLLTAVGRAWADGDLNVRHEHFLSGLLEDILREVRTTRTPPSNGSVFLFATLPGEQHGLGLQMAALVAALRGIGVRILGTDTPLPEIVRAAEESGACAVGVSVSLATGGPSTDREIATLRDALPEGLPLIVGGRGARGVRRGPRDVDYVETLLEFEARLDEWKR